MAEDYRWREIADLPEDIRSITNYELEPLHRIWLEQKDRLLLSSRDVDKILKGLFNMSIKFYTDLAVGNWNPAC